MLHFDSLPQLLNTFLNKNMLDQFPREINSMILRLVFSDMPFRHQLEQAKVISEVFPNTAFVYNKEVAKRIIVESFGNIPENDHI